MSALYSGEIIDAHMHLWDLKNNYYWLNEALPNFEKLVGDYSALRKNFLIQDYLAITAKHNITKAVHIEAFGFPEDPVNESKWIQQIADQYGLPNGTVAYVKLDDPHVEEVLSRHVECKNVRGIRMALNWHNKKYMQMTDRPDYMQDKSWLKGFALLAKYKLSFDLQVYDHQLSEAAILAKNFPDTQIILTHMGLPNDFTESDFKNWRERINQIAFYPNVSIKISRIGGIFQRKVPESLIMAYIQQAIEIFGTDRCLFGSNFPPDSLFYSFDELIHLIKKALVHLSYDDQQKIFYGIANRIYRLN